MKLKNHLLYTLANDVKAICKPLFEACGITYFNYSRVYPDNKITILTTTPEWREYFIANKFQNVSMMDTKPVREKLGNYRIWDIHANLYPNSNNLRIQAAAQYKFNLHHGLTICRDNLAFGERFTFATNQQNHIINEYYEHSPELFKKFTLYFKDKASELIKLSEQVKIDYCLNNSHIEYRMPEINLLDKLKIERFYVETFNGGLYLTQRELNCLNWSFRGKTIEEIAIILNISPSTVKTHIYNAKQKFNVTKIIDIFRVLKEQGILDIYE